MTEDMYKNGTYMAKNPTWDAEIPQGKLHITGSIVF
jgi:hypothetical protein